MIYLAKNEKGELERIQVVRKPDQGSVWGALNYDGTQEIVPFSEDNTNCELVLIALQEKYPNSDIILSKRIVDSQKYHIVCLHLQYCLYDNNSHLVTKFGTELVRFSDSQTYAIQLSEGTSFPDYYVDLNIVHSNKLWVAKDIDTELWVCLKRDGKVISQHSSKEACIHQAIQKLS